MRKEILVPPLGESVTEATIAKWLKKVGDAVQADEAIVELETDKVTLEINAPVAGVVEEIKVAQGGKVAVGDGIGTINSEGAAATISAPASPEPSQPVPSAVSTQPAEDNRLKMPPAVSKMVAETGVDPLKIEGTGKDGRLTKGDVQNYVTTSISSPVGMPANGGGVEERVKMSRLRQRIAERLKEAQNTAAMLTTFNEIDMSNVMAVRAQYKDQFEKKYGVRLGFMSFFVKASVAALKELPAINAEIDGDEIVYKKYYDIGVAVSAPQGLVVPVVRGADELSFADIERKINELGLKARENKLAMTDLTGGTFTITNGGIFGSLMSTPIINPPQSGILGMHKIQERPVAINGKVEIRPMMYVALTYDHRIIDGREAVTFLVRVKECLENPERLLLEI